MKGGSTSVLCSTRPGRDSQDEQNATRIRTSAMTTLFAKTACFLSIFTISLLNCTKDKSPIESEPDAPQIEKDGKINFYIMEIDHINHLDWIIDSVNVDENVHVIDISNAVPFNLPKINGSSIGFFGNFDGLSDTVFVWCDYTKTYKRDNQIKTVRSAELNIIGKNQIVTTISSYNSVVSSPVRGFVFLLDKDQENSGTGMITLKVDDYLDTLSIDAAMNTVNYTQNSVTLDFSLKDINNELKIYTTWFDFDSFEKYQDGAIALIRYYYNGEHFYGATSFVGTGELYLKTTEFTFFGFVPNFILDKVN
jgi:hypothetical protein